MNQKKQTLLSDLTEKQHLFYMELAKHYLHYFGNTNPSINQLCEFQWLLCQALWLPHFLGMDSRLTREEGLALYWSARGKTSKQIADFLNISPRQVERHRAEIFKKLSCQNIAGAVMKGMQFLELNSLI